jgi:hypothetical protein
MKTTNKNRFPFFDKINYKILLVGLGNYLGIYLMAGGGSEDPTVLMKISLTFVEFDWRQQQF